MATKPKKLTLDELASQYGYAASFFYSTPELKALITRAVKEQWTAAKFQAKFQTTKWFRQNASSVRTWIELAKRDPAEYNRRKAERAADLRARAQQMGAPISTARLSRLTEDSLKFGWSDQEIANAMAAEIRYAPGKVQGQAASTEMFIKSTLADYGVSVSNTQVGKWVQEVAQGYATEDHIVDYVRDVAVSKYPGMRAYLDQGMTVRDVAEPYIQSYANILEQNEELIEVNDPRIQKALQGKPPAKPNEPPQMQSVYEFERDLRKDPRWLKTKNANESMTNTGLGILRDFGLVA